MKYILYNPKLNNGKYDELLKKIKGEDAITPVSVFDDESYQKILADQKENDEIYMIGGDGTLNHFINNCEGIELKAKAYYVPNGTGNDFVNDVNAKGQDFVLINDYMKNLPTVIVNDKKYKFINGVGYGIDGYCCEVGDAQHAAGVANVNYTSIAIKGLLFHFKPCKATVTVDGVTKTYKKVWLSPAMKGRYYGGGMIVAPAQDRNDPDHKVTNVVMYGKGKLHTLIVFPSIFKGEHVKHTNMVDVRSGHHIIVEFERPCALQIDGETILGVTKYEVIA